MNKTHTNWEELERRLRNLVFKGWEMGKEQHKEPYKYKCDTDIAEKDYEYIKSFFTSQLKEIRQEIIHTALCNEMIYESKKDGYREVLSDTLQILDSYISEDK